jgi:hypothetical protein
MKSGRIARRRFLRGLGGALVGVPFLEGLLLRGVRAEEPRPIKRFATFFQCNGVNMERFWPSTPYGALSDASFAQGATLEALAPFREHLLIPRGIHMAPRGFGIDASGGDDHARGMGCKLTACALNMADDHYALGISVDQELAKSVNPAGRAPLTLFVGERHPGVAGHISYRGPNDPVIGENNPWLAYRDLMNLAATSDAMVAERLTKRRQSVLDLVRDDMDDLRRLPLSQADRRRLDMHFTSIRELEANMNGSGIAACALEPARAAELEALDPATVAFEGELKRIGQMQMELLALALACDQTRVATLQWGSGASGPVFRWDGMSHDYNHHKLSHGNTRDDDTGAQVDGYLDMVHDIDRWFARQYAYLLARLDAYVEGSATVLENSAIVWMNELSDGKTHDFRDLPYVIAGSAGGRLRTGQYLKVTAQDDTRNHVDAPHNQLLTTLLNAVGAHQGDGSPYTNFGTFGAPGEISALKA